MYLAYRIPDVARRMLMAAFPPPTTMEVVCDHVTRAMDPALDPHAIIGMPASIVVIGRFSDWGNDVLAVTVDGTPMRPDGHFYHITHAIDRSRGGKPVRSRDLVQAAFDEGGEAALHNLRRPIIVPGCLLAAYESAKTPRAVRQARPVEPAKVVLSDLGDGILREDSTIGMRRRSRFLDPSGAVLGVRVVALDTARVLVDKAVFGEAETAEEAVEQWRLVQARPAGPSSRG